MSIFKHIIADMAEILQFSPREEEIKSRLRGQWDLLVQGAGGRTSLINYEFDRMAREYKKGDGRSYHNLEHIAKVDGILNRYRHLARNFVALKFAGDGHDVIYVPGSETNEAESALFMRETMRRLGIPEDTIAESERIINITKEHTTGDGDVDGKLMIDADFANFASPPEEYDAYAQGIWQEYVGSGRLPEAAFRTGRSNLLRGWLGQERLFLTDEIRADLQPIAMGNLQRELDRLAV